MLIPIAAGRPRREVRPSIRPRTRPHMSSNPRSGCEAISARSSTVASLSPATAAVLVPPTSSPNSQAGSGPEGVIDPFAEKMQQDQMTLLDAGGIDCGNHERPPGQSCRRATRAPVRTMVAMCRARASSSARTTLAELPLVLKATSAA